MINKINELYYKWNKTLLRFTTFLISTQIIHLIWLTVVATIPYFLFQEIWYLPENFIFAAIDYLELPALFLTSLYYLSNITKKNIFMFSLICIQLLHIVWVTDEFIVDYAQNLGYIIYFAIIIDYLEMPVIVDFIRKTIRNKR